MVNLKFQKETFQARVVLKPRINIKEVGVDDLAEVSEGDAIMM